MKTKNEVIDVTEVPVAPKEYAITGADAEDIRSLNRALNALRMELSTQVILDDIYNKQMSELHNKLDEVNTKKVELLSDFNKKSTELQKKVEKAFAKTGLDIKDGWTVDPDVCKFFKA